MQLCRTIYYSIVCSTCFEPYYRSSSGAYKLQLQLLVLLTFVVAGRCYGGARNMLSSQGTME